jgi:hypothetical protein
MPVLSRLLSMTTGDVLEIGMGIYSTPLLHWTCIEQNRKLVSIENNTDYYKMFERERNPLHLRFLWNNLMEVNIINKWDIVFIDSEPGSQRKELAMKYADSSKFIILHDSELICNMHYNYSQIIPLFKYSHNCERFTPNTLVLSNTENLDFLNDL